ncbi:TrkA C-terminal domain-containing protein [Salinilacihabitans rarus]|uniref:TrkA C-terminal domain-containing protein n=1 Tax=Salinilacihabitans rarus TaxID=2961596 RepID=UPI0020C8BA37|nr:TrkA C-terminal domain-containing protein [Salinilacihabitans rarus]
MSAPVAVATAAEGVPAAETVLAAAVRILGFSLLSGGVAAGVALLYRWYGDEELPDGVAVLVGVSAVAIWLNTQTTLQEAILGESDLLDPAVAVYTVLAFAVSAIAADAGRRLGDRMGRDVTVATPTRIDDVSQLLRSAGRVVAVDLPKTVRDADGYDPVDPATKAELAGETLLFPRRLSTEALRERLVARLERDYGVGHVDVDLAADGTVEYLAVGSRQSGLGPTLAPGTVAVAVRGDPAPDASPGDAVDVWAVEGAARRVASAELRATAGDVVTLAVDAGTAPALDPEREYRLVTLPGSPDAGREFVSLLRAADETIATLRVGADDPLAGAPVGSLPVFVLAVERDGTVVSLPDADERLAAGDVCYVLGRPEALRRAGETSADRPPAREEEAGERAAGR